MRKRLSACLVLALILTLPAAPGTAAPANLSPHKEELRSYIDTGRYGRDVAKVALKANKYLLKRLTKAAPADRKLAIVFDIDETALTNLPHILTEDFGYRPDIWDAWVAAGQAHAIIPVQTIYDTAVRGGIAVFFITGRKESNAPGTEKNLREVGYETWTRIFYKPVSDPTLTTRGFKTETRRQLTAEGYLIVANIGDQQSDLSGGFAEKTYQLPNPFYQTE